MSVIRASWNLTLAALLMCAAVGARAEEPADDGAPVGLSQGAEGASATPVDEDDAALEAEVDASVLGVPAAPLEVPATGVGLAARQLALPRLMRIRLPAAWGEDDRQPYPPPAVNAAPVPDVLYTADLSDEQLKRAYREDPASLGSISFGAAEQGRLLNGVAMPKGNDRVIVEPSKAFGAQETVDALVRIAREVESQFPGTQLRINHLGYSDGGWIRPHKSHQSGLDVDIGFFYRDPGDRTAPRYARETLVDPARNWAVLKAIVTLADVQFVLADKRVQRVLREYAIAAGESTEWVDELFSPLGLVRHARGHRDHFHVRFYAPRSQELGRRLALLLNAESGEHLLTYRVVGGDSLGRIAARFHTAMSRLKALNHLTSNSLSVGRTLAIPMAGPCARCGVPPQVVVPPRLLPPAPPKS